MPPPTPAKPKILIFRNELLPASETFIRAQAGALHLFEPRFAGIHAAPNSLDLPFPPTLLDNSSTLLGKLRRRLFWATSFAPSFYRHLQLIHPALIHAHFAVDAAAALPIAQRLRIPLVVTLHGYDVTSSDHALGKSVEGRLYLRRRTRLWTQASLFLCISQFIYDRALAAGFPREKLRLHHTGTDLTLFSNTEATRDPNLIVFVGRLVEKKGCDHLLHALELVRRQHPAVRLVCIGSGPQEDQLHARVAASNLPCYFLGPQPPEVVKRCIAQARIFCGPSVTAASGDSEGLGMVFSEAQAMGTPVVSFRHGGIPEIVLDGRTGLLAPEADTAALAVHLLTLLRDDALWHHYSSRGRQWVHQAFDLRKQTQQLETIYAEVLEHASLASAPRIHEQVLPASTGASATPAPSTSSPPGFHP
jgi:colanic acid/amylovoran biosynthesis glycosyltransferase